MRSERWREKRHLLCHSTLARGNKFRNFHFCRDVSWYTQPNRMGHIWTCVRSQKNRTKTENSSPQLAAQSKCNCFGHGWLACGYKATPCIDYATSTFRILPGCGRIAHRSTSVTQMCKWQNQRHKYNEQRIQLIGRCSGHSIFAEWTDIGWSERRTFQFLITISVRWASVVRNVYRETVQRLRQC